MQGIPLNRQHIKIWENSVVDFDKHFDKNQTFSPRPLTFLPLKNSRFLTHVLKNVNTETGL